MTSNLISIAVLAFLATGHIWIFRLVYKSPSTGETGPGPMMRGVVAGVVGNFFAGLYLGILVHRYYIFLIVSGLAAAPAAGVLFSGCFRWVNDRLGLDAGFWGRGVLGACAGAVTGLVIYALLRGASADHGEVEAGFFVWFSVIGSLSAILIRKRTDRDYEKLLNDNY